jgi:hypothetical protein
MTNAPLSLRRRGITSVTSNKKEDQEIVLPTGLLGFYFGDELAAAVAAKKQAKYEVKHG